MAKKITNNQQHSNKTNGKQESTNTVPYYKLFSFADHLDYLLMFVGTIGAVGNGISIPLMTMVFGDILDSFGRTVNTKDIVHEIPHFFYLPEMACWMVTGERQAARIRSLYLNTILRQDIAFFDKEASTGEIIGRMSGDTVLIQNALGEKVGTFVQLVATFIGGFIVAFIKGWLLTSVMLSTIPPLVISGYFMSRIIRKMAYRGQAAYSVAATVVEQTFGSIRTVASYTGEKKAIAKYNKSLTTAYKSGVQEGLAAGLSIGAVMFLKYCSYAMAVWYGGKMIVDKGYTGGDVIAILFSVLIGSVNLGQASPCMSAFAAGQAAAFKMFETIKRKPQIDAYDNSGLKLDDIHGDIELRDVCFSYPARPEEHIFNEFSLSIPGGTTTALVGQSGSGKSTEFQLKWIRQKIGLVSQEPVLLTCSIKDNVAYGKDNATTEEIRVAAELANAAKFIDKLPQGLDTMVGEHGTHLSGGQKQRVAIARAILKDPRILLLDEATSALDAESERIVQEALDRIMTNRTTVIVAHHLSIVRNADTIAVIHQGKIVGKGSHSELIKDPEGAYSQLIHLQDISTMSEQNALNDQEMPELPRRNSSHHSFSKSLGVADAVSVQETTPAETTTPASAPTKLPSEVSLHRLAHLNKPEIPVLLLGTIAAVANGLILPVHEILLSNTIKIFYEPEDKLCKDSIFWALTFIVLGVASLLAQPSKSYLFAIAGCKLIRRIRSKCFEKVVYMEVS
ncbi:hypothetical protein SO802_026943, partial [Lithocarpus litseifolius]